MKPGFKSLISKALLLFMLGFSACSPKIDENRQKPVARNHIKLSFVGDLMHHGTIYSGAKNGKKIDYTPYFSKVSHLLSDADLTIGNLETVVSTNYDPSGYPSFNAPRELLVNLKNVGFDLFSTANNHCLDWGKKGLIDTIKLLEQEGLDYCGTSIGTNSIDRIRFKEIDGVKLAFLSYSYGFNDRSFSKNANHIEFNYNPKRNFGNLTNDIEYCKEQGSDFVVLMAHWGLEYERRPNYIIRDQARLLLEKGVDIIVGSHPHVLQPSEFYTTEDGRECFVAYSIGNFLSAYGWMNGKQGVILNLYIPKNNKSKRIGVEAIATYCKSFPKEKSKRRYQIVSLQAASTNNELAENIPYVIEQQKFITNLIAGRELDDVFSKIMQNELDSMRIYFNKGTVESKKESDTITVSRDK